MRPNIWGWFGQALGENPGARLHRWINNHQVRTTCKSLDVKQVDELRMSIFHDAKFSTVIPVLHSELSKVSKFALSCLQGLDRPRWKDLGSLKMGYQEVFLVNC